MEDKLQKERFRGLYACVLLATLLAMIGCATLDDSLETAQATPSKQVFMVTHTTVDSCLEILEELGLGWAVERLPNMLEVTGTAEELDRARTIMRLIDTSELYAVETLGPVSGVRSMASNDVIARRLEGVTVGTFVRPPAAIGSARIVIDLIDARVVAIAPRTLMPQIKKAVAAGPSEFLALFEEPKLSEDLGKTSIAAQEPVADVVTVPRDAGEVTELEILNNEPREQADTADQERSAAIAESKQDEGTSDRIPRATSRDGATESGQAPTTTFIRAATRPTPTTHRRPIKPVLLENGDDIVELTLPETLSLIELLDLVGEYLDLDYLYDPAQIPDQALTLKLHGKLQGDLRVRDLYSLLETVLKFKGLAMTRGRDDLVAIVPLAEALEVDPELVDPSSDSLSAGDLVVTRVFHLQHIAPTAASKLLEEMKLSVAMTPVEETRVLFVTCYAHRLERIEYLLSLIDQPGEPRALAIRTLQYTMAAAIAEKVRTLALELDDMAVSLAAPAKGGRGSGQAKPAKGIGQAVFLDTDERTNRILMIGRDAQLALVQQLIDTLDVQQRDLRTLQVYTINFAEAGEVVSKLAEFGAIGSSSSASGGASRSGRSNANNREAIADAPSEQAQVMVLEATHSLLIFATAEQHGQIKQIIGYLDVSAVDLRTTRVYAIHHVDALDVEAKLRSLQLIGTQATGTNSRSPLRNARITAAKPDSSVSTPRASADISDTQWVILEISNSLLVHAIDEVHGRIQEIIDLVDIKPSEQSNPYEIYFLETQAPEQLADILSRIVQETVVDSEGKVEQTISRMEDQIIIVPDASTFSLIVYASRKHQEWISKLITTLDKRRPQVLIDVTLVEIRKTEEFNYDLNLISSFPDLIETGGQTGSFLVDGQSVVDKLLEPGMRSRFVDFQSTSGLGTGFYADTHVNALLTAMQSKNYGRVLAKPKILVNDNQAGIIRTTDTTYVTKKSSIPIASGAGGQQTTLVETAVDYEGYDAGITLEITPHTSESPLLRLDINLTRSDFGNITGEAPPDTSSSDLTTIVTVPDGSTIILGGMLRLNQSKGGKKVPILGDLPIVGGLFRGFSNKDIENKLYIFVRAEIIRPEDTLAAMQDKLKRISDQNRAAFERHEKEFQDYENWPGVPPKPMAPERVLDMQ